MLHAIHAQRFGEWHLMLQMPYHRELASLCAGEQRIVDVGIQVSVNLDEVVAFGGMSIQERLHVIDTRKYFRGDLRTADQVAGADSAPLRYISPQLDVVV